MAYQNAYALTGGIATGKSTVCSLLKIQGFSIIDADVIAKEELKNATGQIREAFGDDVFEQGRVDRKKLANLIFNSKQKREKLNAILHPRIREKIDEQAKLLDVKGIPFILDIPLFFESGGYECKMSVVVYTPKEIQLQRLINREGLSEAEANKRVEAQMDIEEKKLKADWVIDNSKDLKYLQKEVEKFVEYVRGEYASIKI